MRLSQERLHSRGREGVGNDEISIFSPRLQLILCEMGWNDRVLEWRRDASGCHGSRVTLTGLKVKECLGHSMPKSGHLLCWKVERNHITSNYEAFQRKSSELDQRKSV